MVRTIFWLLLMLAIALPIAGIAVAYWATSDSAAERHLAVERAGIRDLVARCDACHDQLRGADPTVPRINGQPIAYLVDALSAYADGRRVDPVMNAQVQDLDAGTKHDLATYYASRPR